MAFDGNQSEDPSKREWVKAVLEEMLVEIKEYDSTAASCPAEESPAPEMATDTETSNEMTPANTDNSVLNDKTPANATNGGRPLFTITPAANVNPAFTDDVSPGNVSAAEIVIGLHESDSTPKLMNGMRSRDSRESLIPEERKESWYNILAEVCIPFLIAGLGMVGAGLILDVVKEWKVFKDVAEFLVLVTPLLGLKGNLEMTLASRLSTHANLGHMSTLQAQMHICLGNIALTQVQAIVVGFLASVVAITMGMILDGHFVWSHALLLCTCSVLTAAIASFALGILMVAVIILSTKFHLNPDNIATPIAASLGDVTTLGLLACIASFLYEHVDEEVWLSPAILVVSLMLTPFWALIAYRNEFTKKILYTGWTPVLCAMVMSSGGGMILDMAEQRFPRIALYQPGYNGVGGNLASVQASRISTALHKYCERGTLPEPLPAGSRPSRICLTPWSVFTKQGVHSTSARVLLAIVIPGHIIFCITSYYLSGTESSMELSVLFFVVYLTAALVQVGFLLYVAHVLTNWLWVHKHDPDTSTIPYLTALGDLIGTGLLFLVFSILYALSTETKTV